MFRQSTRPLAPGLRDFGFDAFLDALVPSSISPRAIRGIGRPANSADVAAAQLIDCPIALMR